MAIQDAEYQSIIELTDQLRNLPSELDFTGLHITSAEQCKILSIKMSEWPGNNQIADLSPNGLAWLSPELESIEGLQRVGSQDLTSHTLEDVTSNLELGSALGSTESMPTHKLTPTHKSTSTYESMLTREPMPTHELTPRSMVVSAQESSSPWEPVESESKEHQTLPPTNDFDICSVSMSVSSWISRLSANLSASDIDAIEDLCLNPNISGETLRHTLHYLYNLQQDVVEIIVRLSRGAI